MERLCSCKSAHLIVARGDEYEDFALWRLLRNDRDRSHPGRLVVLVRDKMVVLQVTSCVPNLDMAIKRRRQQDALILQNPEGHEHVRVLGLHALDGLLAAALAKLPHKKYALPLGGNENIGITWNLHTLDWRLVALELDHGLELANAALVSILPDLHAGVVAAGKQEAATLLEAVDCALVPNELLLEPRVHVPCADHALLTLCGSRACKQPRVEDEDALHRTRGIDRMLQREVAALPRPYLDCVVVSPRVET